MWRRMQLLVLQLCTTSSRRYSCTVLVRGPLLEYTGTAMYRTVQYPPVASYRYMHGIYSFPWYTARVQGTAVYRYR